MTDFATQMQLQQAVQASRKTPTMQAGQKIEQVRQKAQEFEAVFLGQMLQPLFENIEAAEPFGGGASEKMWQSMMVDEYGKGLARAGGIGLADRVMREMLKGQEVMQ